MHAHTYVLPSSHTHTHACPRTHTLTQFSKELYSQSCIDEEQQHEEQTQIPHLDGHITRIYTQIYTVYDTQRKETCTVYIERDTNMPAGEKEARDTEASLPGCLPRLSGPEEPRWHLELKRVWDVRGALSQPGSGSREAQSRLFTLNIKQFTGSWLPRGRRYGDV